MGNSLLRICVLFFVSFLAIGCVSKSNPPSKRDFGFWIVKSGDTLSSIAWKSGWKYHELAAANGIDPPYRLTVGQKIFFDRKVPRHIAHAPSTQPRPQNGLALQWPIQGKVSKPFHGKNNKGIDIQGKVGQPVKAAQSGVVVYAGGELAGYGQLVIVKHNNEWLTAYAHNQSILVTEGERVKQGQKLASVGYVQGKPGIHFEVRYLGKPVNPEVYLP